MARHIPNADKLHRILAHERRPSDDPFLFSIDESKRIRQLIGEGLVAFFAKLNGVPIPPPQPIPGEENISRKPRRRKR